MMNEKQVKIIINYISLIKFKLNMIIIITWALIISCITGIIAGIVLFILVVIGNQNLNQYSWLSIILLSFVPGVITGYIQRIDLKRAAIWIDRHLKIENVLSAALLCIDRNCDKLFDEKILEKAELLISERRKIKYPYKQFMKLIFISGIIFFIAIPLFTYIPKSGYFNSTDFARKGSFKKIQKKQSIFDNKSNKEISQMLIPLDKELAKEFEKAMKEGDYKKMEKILSENKANMQKRLNNTTNEKEKQFLLDSLRNQGEFSDELDEDMKNDAAKKKKSEKSSSDVDSSKLNNDENNKESQKEMNDGKGEKTVRELEEQNNQDKNAGENNNDVKTKSNSGQDNENNKDEKNLPGKNDNSKNKKSTAGSEKNPDGDKNSNSLNWEKQNMKTAKDKINLKDEEEFSNQYILQNKDPETSFYKLIEDSQKKSEKSYIKENIPEEYKKIINNYFLDLQRKNSSTE
ncbi:MAG: hypothetical protein M1308_01540 [Actinobacteria bacterium]|nr:hypothetical protein [Actinomycetota bacterium]